MIRRITDRFLVWVIAVALMWALLVQPAFIRLGSHFEEKYQPTHSTLCPTDGDSQSC